MRDEIKSSEIVFYSDFKVSYNVIVFHRCQSPTRGKKLILKSRSFEILDIIVGNKSCLIPDELINQYPNLTGKESFNKNILENGFSDINMDTALVGQDISIKAINRGNVEEVFKAILLGLMIE